MLLLMKWERRRTRSEKVGLLGISIESYLTKTMTCTCHNNDNLLLLDSLGIVTTESRSRSDRDYGLWNAPAFLPQHALPGHHLKRHTRHGFLHMASLS